jgi:DNA-binding transcriptional LysR family regulator
LTEAGCAFLPEARAMIAQAERAIRAARRGARGELGRLRIGFTSSAAFIPIMPAAVRAFKRTYPEVELSLSEANTTVLLEHLAEEDLDVVFIRPGRSDPEGVQVYHLAEEAMVIVLPSSHPLARAGALPLSSVSREPFVLFPRDAGPSLFDEVIAGCRRAGFEPILGQEAPQISTVGNLVAAELGVSVVPASIAQVRVAGVEYVPIAEDPPIARLALVIRLNECSPVVHNFAALVVAEPRIPRNRRKHRNHK